MQASLILTSLLPFLAAAAPAQSKTGSPPFALISARSASPVHLLPFTAAGGYIYLDGTTDVVYHGAQPKYNTTVFKASNGGAKLVRAYSCSEALVPSPCNASAAAETKCPLLTTPQYFTIEPEQTLSVGTTGLVGALTYTAPVASTDLEKTFTYTPGVNGSLGDLNFSSDQGGGFLACPVNGNSPAPYQVYVDVAGVESARCLGIDALASPYTGEEAYEYL